MEPPPRQGCARQLGRKVQCLAFPVAADDAATLAMNVISHTLTQVTIRLG